MPTLLKRIPFSKYHGLGNDYLFLDAFETPELALQNLHELAVRMSHRRYGPGSDGIVLLAPSAVADVKMRIFNPDGSEAENCGNALRCIARICHERAYAAGRRCTVELANRTADVFVDPKDTDYQRVSVNLGRAVWDRAAIPMTGTGDPLHTPLQVTGMRFDTACLSVGNPHCVVFLPGYTETDVVKLGPLIENNPLFPNRVNTGFCDVVDAHNIRLTVWERGAGLTGACGTGATAAFAAAHRRKKVASFCEVKMPGGSLSFTLDADENILMTGPAEHVYDGVFTRQDSDSVTR